MKVVRIRSRHNEIFYFDIFVDVKNVVVEIDNQWDVKLPVWVGGTLDVLTLEDYFNKKRNDFYFSMEL
jgi:hypothetical protein